MRTLPFNKVCEIEDFGDPSLRDYIREAMADKVRQFGPNFPVGFENRKDWEIGMAVRALGEFGALRRDAVILGVGAGKEAALFSLTRRVAQVFATDLYYEPAEWKDYAPPVMLVEPAAVTSTAFDEERLVVQHMDGRRLRYPDNMFDGIFSSGSIEHFGDLDDIASAMYEMGRVLKPGGILTLSTELLLSDTDGRNVIPGTILFDVDALQEYVIGASGLETVDALVTDVSPKTLSEPVSIIELLEARRRSPVLERDLGVHRFPALVMSLDRHLFASVHLALRKAEEYPKIDNGWACPQPSLIASIRARNLAAAGFVVPALDEPADGEVPDGQADFETIEFVKKLRMFEEALSRESDVVEDLSSANIQEATEVVGSLEHLDRARFSSRVDVRQELDVLQTQYQALERRVLLSRTKVDALSGRLAELRSEANAFIERFNEQEEHLARLRSTNQALQEQLANIGPSSLGLARRLTALAQRYPRSASAGKAFLWSLLRLSRNIGRTKGGPG